MHPSGLSSERPRIKYLLGVKTRLTRGRLRFVSRYLIKKYMIDEGIKLEFLKYCTSTYSLFISKCKPVLKGQGGFDLLCEQHDVEILVPSSL